jgi:hypothetical protein
MINGISFAIAIQMAVVSTITGASAQTKSPLVGIWILENVIEVRDGKQIETWGPRPKGMLVLDEAGWFSQHQMRSDRPKLAGKGRLDGTPDDDKIAVRGTLGYYGNYAVNDAEKTITFRYEASTWPNQEGTEAKRPFELSGDELRTVNPASTTAAGGVVTLHWKRAK